MKTESLQVHLMFKKESEYSTFEHLFTCWYSTNFAEHCGKFNQNFLIWLFCACGSGHSLYQSQDRICWTTQKKLEVLHPSLILKHDECSLSQNSSFTKIALAIALKLKP